MWVIALLILGLIGLILRELICWYWKINEQLALLTEIRDLLKRQDSNVPDLNGPREVHRSLEPPMPKPATPPVPKAAIESGPKMGTCPNCSELIPRDSTHCPKCYSHFLGDFKIK